MLLKDKRIFIVEDNPQNRIVYKMVLTLSNGAITEFDRWGREVLTRLKAFRPVDLIILDLMFLMDSTNGYEIFRQIRSTPDYAGVPIVAVSAAEPALALAKTRELGFDGFIAKPIDDERFPQQIARLIAGEQVWYAGERFTGV